MPIQADFVLAKFEDGVLTISMVPAVAIGAWDIRFQLNKNFGMGQGSGLINKSCCSGFNGVSGITVTNSGQGTFNVSIQGINTSGLDYGNYAYTVQRYNSGFSTVLSRGYLLLEPSM